MAAAEAADAGADVDPAGASERAEGEPTVARPARPHLPPAAPCRSDGNVVPRSGRRVAPRVAARPRPNQAHTQRGYRGMGSQPDDPQRGPGAAPSSGLAGAPAPAGEPVPGPLPIQPTEAEVEEWATRERLRREAWLKGPTPEEKQEWAHQERERRLAALGQSSATGAQRGATARALRPRGAAGRRGRGRLVLEDGRARAWTSWSTRAVEDVERTFPARRRRPAPCPAGRGRSPGAGAPPARSVTWSLDRLCPGGT